MPRVQQLPVPLGLKLYPEIIHSLGYDPYITLLLSGDFIFLSTESPQQTLLSSLQMYYEKKARMPLAYYKVTLSSSKIFMFFSLFIALMSHF